MPNRVPAHEKAIDKLFSQFMVAGPVPLNVGRPRHGGPITGNQVVPVSSRWKISYPQETSAYKTKTNHPPGYVLHFKTRAKEMGLGVRMRFCQWQQISSGWRVCCILSFSYICKQLLFMI